MISGGPASLRVYERVHLRDSGLFHGALVIEADDLPENAALAHYDDRLGWVLAADDFMSDRPAYAVFVRHRKTDRAELELHFHRDRDERIDWSHPDRYRFVVMGGPTNAVCPCSIPDWLDGDGRPRW